MNFSEIENTCSMAELTGLVSLSKINNSNFLAALAKFEEDNFSNNKNTNPIKIVLYNCNDIAIKDMLIEIGFKVVHEYDGNEDRVYVMLYDVD